jgi:hypothetical protein
MQFSDKVSNIVRGAQFDPISSRCFYVRALEFLHSQDP